MSEGDGGTVVVRYPGRACLLGEHCDWAGGASLAVPLPLGVRVEASVGEPGTGVSVETSLGGALRRARWPTIGSVEPDGGPLRFVSAVLHLLTGLGIDLPDTALVVESDLPPGRGFSSSAAFTLGVLDAMARRGGQVLERRTLAELAYEVEHDLLGVECGRLDEIACAEAAPVFVDWRDPTQGIFEVRAVATAGTFHLTAIALPAARDTKKILAALNRHFGGEPRPATGRDAPVVAVRAALAAFAREAEAGRSAMEGGDAPALGDAMNRAQESYERKLAANLVELRAPLLESTCARLRSEGALGAKFSGAGGDGSVIALFATQKEALSAAARFTGDGVGTGIYCPIG